MRRLRPLLLILLSAGAWLLTSSDVGPGSYYNYTPYFMERSELERSVFYTDGARKMVEPGKIWVQGDKLYVNERYKGVHIIDNSDPSNPVQSGFIVAPGCLDMAVKGSIIYVDNAVDLVAFDMAQNRVTERLKNFFPAPPSPDGERYYWNHDADKIVVGWRKKSDRNDR